MEEYLFRTLHFPVERIHFYTRSEWLSSASIFFIQKSHTTDSLLAFSALLTEELHSIEDWKKSETKQEEIALIVKNFLVPSLQECEVEPIDSQIVHREIQSLLKEFNDYYTAKRKTEGGLDATEGIFYNDHLISEDKPLPVETDSILQTISLQNQWNHREFFYETSSMFVLFIWSTGA